MWYSIPTNNKLGKWKSHFNYFAFLKLCLILKPGNPDIETTSYILIALLKRQREFFGNNDILFNYRPSTQWGKNAKNARGHDAYWLRSKGYLQVKNHMANG